MRFMMMIKGGQDYEPGVPPSHEMMAAMGELTEELTKTGALILTGGLERSSKGARVRVSGGKLTVIDGPFAEAKELIGGFAIVEAKSKEEAIEMGSRVMKLHQDILGTSYDGECEVRQMFVEPPEGVEHG